MVCRTTSRGRWTMGGLVSTSAPTSTPDPCPWCRWGPAPIHPCSAGSSPSTRSKAAPPTTTTTQPPTPSTPPTSTAHEPAVTTILLRNDTAGIGAVGIAGIIGTGYTVYSGLMLDDSEVTFPWAVGITRDSLLIGAAIRQVVAHCPNFKVAIRLNVYNVISTAR